MLSKTKHIAIRYHFVRDLVEAKIVVIEYVPTSRQLADIFTKALDLNTFLNLRKSIGICEAWSALAMRGDTYVYIEKIDLYEIKKKILNPMLTNRV